MISNSLLVLSSFLIIYLDIKHRKVFNIVAYPLMAIATAINIYLLGSVGALYSLTGLISGLFACYIAYKLNFSGLGEFKLLALIGILKGSYFVLIIGLISCFLVCLAQIISIITSGNAKIIIQNRKIYLDLILQYGISVTTILEEHVQKPLVPYSVAVLTAVFVGLGLGI